MAHYGDTFFAAKLNNTKSLFITIINISEMVCSVNVETRHSLQLPGTDNIFNVAHCYRLEQFAD